MPCHISLNERWTSCIACLKVGSVGEQLNSRATHSIWIAHPVDDYCCV